MLAVRMSTILCLMAAIAAAAPQVKLRVETAHPWRPPFGTERVGQGRVAVVEAVGDEPLPELTLSARLAGKEVGRLSVRIPDKSPRIGRVALDGIFDFDELALADIVTTKVDLPRFEADATARPDKLINPVDLGAILPPADWLVLGPGESGSITVRAIQRGEPRKDVAVKAWFESAKDKPATAAFPLTIGKPTDTTIALPVGVGERDVLHVSITSGGQELWQKTITTMRIASTPTLPRFGVVETKLRYDAPISLRDPSNGSFSSIPFTKGFDAKLNDIVVALPNGGRLVFWRGSSYIPFWLTRHNVGICSEWAECIGPWPPDRVDCIEPLMDKELRYGRVEVVESTPARVHVRWTYQSCDLLYKVWGDQAVEDYYLYPDGFGTRVLTLTRDPARNYELSEFILIGPQEKYPLSFVPAQPVDMLFLDGETRHVSLPANDASLGPPRDVPAVYRVRPHKDDPTSFVYFSPRIRKFPMPFGAFYDQGQLVTPAYWGSHWPLARGNMTGSKIDDRIHATPHHTSLMSWVDAKPDPISTRTGPSIDSLGHSRVMTTERWAWMIGMTDAPDADVLARAKSFATPPSIEASGARVHPDGYVAERRAVRLIADRLPTDITLKLTSPGQFVSPIFEIDGAPQKLIGVSLDGQALDARRYAWDGHVLWLDVAFAKSAELKLSFGPI